MSRYKGCLKKRKWSWKGFSSKYHIQSIKKKWQLGLIKAFFVQDTVRLRRQHGKQQQWPSPWCRVSSPEYIGFDEKSCLNDRFLFRLWIKCVSRKRMENRCTYGRSGIGRHRKQELSQWTWKGKYVWFYLFVTDNGGFVNSSSSNCERNVLDNYEAHNCETQWYARTYVHYFF